MPIFSFSSVVKRKVERLAIYQKICYNFIRKKKEIAYEY